MFEHLLSSLLKYLDQLFGSKQLRQPKGTPEYDWREKIKREDIVRFLRKHEATELEIIHKSLDDIDLSGLDLSGATFFRCTFRNANLSDCNFKGASFQRGYFGYTNLSKSILDLTDFSDSYIRDSDLSHSSFYRATLDGVDFKDSNLEGANFYRASLRGAKRLTRNSLGNKILQDSGDKLEASLRWQYIKENKITDLDAKLLRHRNYRLINGEHVYRQLKVVFAENGQYSDSSWAYVRERQIRRQRHNPFRAKINFLTEYPENGRFVFLRRFIFYFKHFWLWLLDWLAEVSCGYGEKPFLTIFWAAMALIVFPFIYMASGGISGPSNWLDYFNYSLAAFTTLGFEQFTAETALAQTLTSIEAILGISILALLMFVLGNRISRG